MNKKSRVMKMAAGRVSLGKLGLFSLLCVFGVSCENSSEPSTNGELHWSTNQALKACQVDTECGNPTLMCLCGVCSVPCESETACQGAPTGVMCVPKDALPNQCPTGSPAPGICLKGCDSDAECDIGVCQRGQCVPTPPTLATACQEDPDGDGIRSCDEDYYGFDPEKESSSNDDTKDRIRPLVVLCPPPSEAECSQCDIFAGAKPQVDIVLMMDTSGSMAANVDPVAARMAELINDLDAAGWDARVAVSLLNREDTTAIFKGWHQGSEVVRGIVSELYRSGNTGSGSTERGLDSTKRVLTYLQSSDSGDEQVRPEAKIVTIFATDEEDEALKSAGQSCTDTACPSMVEADYIKYFEGVGPMLALTPGATQGCGEDATAYNRAAVATGGGQVDLCNESLSLITQLRPSLTLSYKPSRPLASSTISVFVDGQVLSQGAQWRQDVANDQVTLDASVTPTDTVVIKYDVCQ